METKRHDMTEAAGHHINSGEFSREVSGLAPSRPTERVALSNGDEFDLQIAPVAKRIGDAVVRMLAYNGSIPGPTLQVKQGSEIVVNVVNEGDVETTVHWHGLRLDYRYDGVPHDTQPPIPIGGRFSYRLRFPDEGLYWYHPHLREDYGQDMGLYGNILVEPADPEYWPPVDREVILTIDDILLEDGQLAAYDRSGPNYTAMGRFGNHMLVNGRLEWSLEAARGEVVRFWLTNTANTRVFNLNTPGALMKLVGGDSGRVEKEIFVDEILLAPSERRVVDVLFDRTGEWMLEHRTPTRSYPLGRVLVRENAAGFAAGSFRTLRTSPELASERMRIGADLEREPDKVLALVAEMHMGGAMDAHEGGGMAHGVHGEGGMHHEASAGGGMDHHGGHGEGGMDHEASAGLGMVPEAHGAGGDDGMRAHPAGGIEWEDTMVEMNRMTTPENMRWLLVDRATGKRNEDIEWSFKVGNRVKIRLVNEMDSDHPMHHPFHIHGAGRFLVLSRDGAPESNLVWKDTVLIRTGEVVDILLEVTNPGRWMAHCHIAEHAESQMMFTFEVTGDRREP